MSTYATHNYNYMFKLLLSLIAVSIFTLTGASNVHAQEIGNGFRCEGTTILNKKNKVVPVAAAKRTIDVKINALGNSSKDKAKKAELKKVKTNLTACSKGTFVPDTGAAGTYTGTLTRTSFKGPSSACEYDATITGSFTITKNGNSYSSPAAQNPLQDPANLVGKKKGNAYVLSDSVGFAQRTVYTVTISNITPDSANIAVAQKGYAYSPIKRRFVELCHVNYAAAPFSRVQ